MRNSFLTHYSGIKKAVMLFLCFLMIHSAINAQSVAINTDGTTANTSALLDVKSTAKGVLIPRMSRTERNAIASPATGLLIFQNGPDSIGFHYYDGTKWTWIVSNSNTDSLAWRTAGNTGTTDANNFIGTKDNIPFNVRVNNQKAGRIDNTLANAFWGYQAGNANTTGLNNVAFGHQAFQSNLSGTNNTAIGGLAASSNTTGNNNTATGYAASILNTVGQSNTAYGFYAMYNNVAGSSATAIGFQSMLYANNTTIPNSNNNVALGYESLQGSPTSANNTGINNTALGYQTLFNNTSGGSNTSGGFQASYGNTTGYSNVAVGVKALYTNTASNNLVAVGDSSLYNGTGIGNTAVGSKAGFNLTTGTNNLFLGYQAGYNVTTGSNKLYIANNNTDPPIIYGDFSNNTIGIGTITPNSTYSTAKVEIASEGINAPEDMLIRNAANNNGYAPGYIVQHSRGTLAAPLAVISGDFLGAPSWSYGYDGTSYQLAATINVYTDGPVSAGKVPGAIYFGTRDTAGVFGTRMSIKNNGNIGMGTISPNSTLHVDGTIAVGVSMGIAGGSSGSPASLATAKYYIGLSPADAINNYYQLPSPATYPGRVYIIRDNSASNQAILTTATGSLYAGNSSGAGATYTLNFNSSPKTVMCISDGVNWTVIQQN